MAFELEQQSNLAVSFVARRPEREQIAGFDPELAPGDLLEFIFDDRTREMPSARGDVADRAKLGIPRGRGLANAIGSQLQLVS